MASAHAVRHSLCFINTHLPAGHSHADERNATASEVEEAPPRLRRSRARRAVPPPLEHDVCVWLGDLNYRIELSNEEVRPGSRPASGAPPPRRPAPDLAAVGRRLRELPRGADHLPTYLQVRRRHLGLRHLRKGAGAVVDGPGAVARLAGRRAVGGVRGVRAGALLRSQARRRAAAVGAEQRRAAAAAPAAAPPPPAAPPRRRPRSSTSPRRRRRRPRRRRRWATWAICLASSASPHAAAAAAPPPPPPPPPPPEPEAPPPADATVPAARGNAVGFSTSADWGASDAFAAPGGFWRRRPRRHRRGGTAAAGCGAVARPAARGRVEGGGEVGRR